MISKVVLVSLLACQGALMSGPSLLSSSVTTIGDIRETAVLDDLSTVSGFSESAYPAKSALGKDAFGNVESDWQLISVVPGVRAWTETYFYFYHPLCGVPVYTGSSGSTFDVDFRLSMAVTGSLDLYSHYWLNQVNHSDDRRFYKFVVNDDFSRVMEDSSYRCFDVSELEILGKSHVTSNSYSVSKRFAWTEQVDGSYKETSQSLNVISSDVFYDYFRISGVNGSSLGPSVNFPLDFTGVTSDVSVPKVDYSSLTWHPYAKQTDCFYVIFSVGSSLGQLCGVDISFVKYLNWSIYDKTSWDLGQVFDQNEAAKFASCASLGKDTPGAKVVTKFDGLSGDYGWKSVSSSVRLSTGYDSDFVGITDMSPSVADEVYTKWDLFWNGKNDGAYRLGYSDKYDLPAIQKLSRLSSGGYVFSGDYSHSSTNPYAISSSTVSYLNSSFGGLSGLTPYIFRFDLEDFAIYDIPDVSFASRNYGYRNWSMSDVDVMDLRFFKDGVFYTIGVVADSGQIITDGHVSTASELFSFSWTWLVLILGVLCGIAVVWLLIKVLQGMGGTRS